MRLGRGAARGPLLAALALVLTVLGLQSSLLRLVPWDLAAFPLNALVALGLFLLLLPALAAPGSPLPFAAAVTVPVLALAQYGESKLDWLRTLKDFEVAEEGTSVPRLLWALAALVLLAALHAADFAVRLRERALLRGVPAEHADAAMRASLLRSAAAVGFALGVTALLAVLGLSAAALGERLALGTFAFVVPLVATALVAVGAFLLVRGPRGSADEAQ